MKKILFIVAVASAVIFATQSYALVRTLDDVAAYNWHRGCAPTSAGMIFGYYDGRGYENLFDGNADTMTNEVKMLIGSQDYLNDYCKPIDTKDTILMDLSDPSHPDHDSRHENNCIADFMKTSRSVENLWYGATWSSQIDNGMEDYVTYRGYEGNAWNENWGAFTFADLVNEIDNLRPILMHVDSNADGQADHAVTAIGYNDETNQYACYNTYNANVHWHDFSAVAQGQEYGVSGATFFVMTTEPVPEPATIIMIIGAFGGIIPVVRRVRRV